LSELIQLERIIESGEFRTNCASGKDYQSSFGMNNKRFSGWKGFANRHVSWGRENTN
jgi:hypothetical protein